MHSNVHDATAPDGDFVERFVAAWRSRDERRLSTILHPDVVLRQPLGRPTHGQPEAVRMLAHFLALIPDLEITIHDSVRRDQVLFIAFSFRGTIGARRVEWDLVDRVELKDGLVIERTCYFDPRPVLIAVLTQPWVYLHARNVARQRRARNGTDAENVGGPTEDLEASRPR